MKKILWMLGALFVVDALVMTYFFVFRADYYFPGRYEDALTAGAIGGAVGILLMIAFALVLAQYLRPRGPWDKK